MTEIFSVTIIFIFFMMAILQENRGGRLMFAQTGDEDIKIAPGSFSRKGADSLEADAAAQLYLKHKSAGNIEKARGLGESYAALLAALAKEYLPPEKSDQKKLRAHHNLILFSYVVNRVISDFSPDSVLAQTALNVFYDSIDEKTPELVKHVRDMAAFSLYILCERSDSSTYDEIGRIYANVCGSEGDESLIWEGNRLYQEFYQRCAKMHDQAGYSAV
jgi:hypothetical protein